MRRLKLVFIILLLLAPPTIVRDVEAAVGDAVATCASVAAGASQNVQPGAGVEWIVHNIWFEYNVQVIRTDGTNTAATVELIGPDWQNFLAIHVTNGNWLQLKNTHGTLAKVICYDGIQTK